MELGILQNCFLISRARLVFKAVVFRAEIAAGSPWGFWLGEQRGGGVRIAPAAVETLGARATAHGKGSVHVLS